MGSTWTGVVDELRRLDLADRVVDAGERSEVVLGDLEVAEAPGLDEHGALDGGHGLVVGVDAGADRASELVEAVAHPAEPLVELAAQPEHLGGRLGQRGLLPAVGDRAEHADERGRRRQHDVALDGVFVEVGHLLQRGDTQLDDYVKRSKLIKPEDVWQLKLREVQHQGKTWALPYSIDLRVIYIDADH